MNIALPAFLLLVAVIPGFVFLRTLRRCEHTTLENGAFETNSAIAFLIAALLHLPLALFGSTIWLSLLFKLLTGTELASKELEFLALHSWQAFLYFIGNVVFAYLSALVLQAFILKYWPYKSSILAFDTPWYYDLKGKLSGEQDAELVKLSCMVSSREGTFLYYGWLDEFYLTQDGHLDRLILKGVSRRSIHSDEASDLPSTERFYLIKGDRLILKYEHIENINLEYLTLEEA